MSGVGRSGSLLRRCVGGVLACGMLAMTVSADRGPAIPETPVESVVGQGLARLLCAACGAVIVGAGGATIAGIMEIAAIAPEAVIACGFACFLAAE